MEAWKEFVKGKKNNPDVQQFSIKLMDNILSLNRDLSQSEYRHGGYSSFLINDPKQRIIHKASVRDRLLHRAVYRVLYPFFNKTFICDSFSSRKDKGMHKALWRFREFANKTSENNTKTCWILKCDIRKFFANINHSVLLSILQNYINDQKAIDLLKEIIESHSSKKMGIGLPLGNLTSQLFINIYLNEFDQFVKHRLKAKNYIRYADDFVIFSQNKGLLNEIIVEIYQFLEGRLKLTLNFNKVCIKSFASGVDFLGYITFPHHRVLRTRTKKRMFQRVSEKNLSSYLGLLKHCCGYKLEKELLKLTNRP